MRVCAVLAASCLLAAACSGGSDTAATSPTTERPASATSIVTESSVSETTQPAPPAAPPSTEVSPDFTVDVTSPDGALAIRVAIADHQRLAPTIDILDPAEWPPEVAGGANLPGVTLYDLQPHGAVFDTPVVVTRRVAATSFPDLGPFDIPLITLLTHSDGEYELLDDLTAWRLGDEIYVSGTTSHFSGLLTSSEGAVLELGDDLGAKPLDNLPRVATSIMPSTTFEIGGRGSMPPRPINGSDFAFLNEDTFERSTAVTDDPGEQLYRVAGFQATTVEFEAYDQSLSAEAAIGAGLATMTFEIGYAAAPSAAQLLGDAIDAEFDSFEYHARLLLAGVPDELYEDALDLIDDLLTDLEDEIDLIVEVFHETFGEYPSYTIRRYRGLRLPPGLVAYSALFQGSVGAPRLVSFAGLEPIDGELSSRSGIECFCDYGELLFFFDDALADDLMDLPAGPAGTAAFWEFVGANPASVAGRVLQRADVDPTKTIAIGPAEGILVDEKATLAGFP